MTIPFTAARGRNEGFHALQGGLPSLRYIQFVDGDCEVLPGWRDAARNSWSLILRQPWHVAGVASGIRNIPSTTGCATWNGIALGEAKACGGDAIFRTAALVEVGGYRGDLIAGEEPELCVRLRRRGWKVWRIDHDMTLHDAGMTRFGQWWKRSLRSGNTFCRRGIPSWRKFESGIGSGNHDGPGFGGG